MSEKLDIIVIGGGCAGIMAANQLTQHTNATVTPIHPCPTFVERSHLHHLENEETP